jgi:hypothetical protein
MEGKMPNAGAAAPATPHTDDDRRKAIQAQYDELGRRLDAYDKRHAKDDDDAKARFDAAVADAVRKELDRRDRKRHRDDEAQAVDPEEHEQEREEQKEEGKKDRRRKDDAARSDDDDDSKHFSRHDSLRANSRSRADSLNAMDQLAERESEWAKVCMALGDRDAGIKAMLGESPLGYDRRMSRRYQRYSDQWRDVDLREVEPGVIRNCAPQIRADAWAAASKPEPGAVPMLREVKRTDRAGRIISEFVGPVSAVNGMLEPFRLPRQRAVINRWPDGPPWRG